jgi:hypothetical protein
MSRDIGPYRIMFMNVCAIITVVMAMQLRGFGPYDIFMIVFFYYFTAVVLGRLCTNK